MAPKNKPPVVNAGPDQTVTLPFSIGLSGTATDDGLPKNSVLVHKWTKITGPGNVTFSNSTSLNTNATFSTSGSYTLRLTTSDGQLSSGDNVLVTVNPAAQVEYQKPELPRVQVDITYSPPTGQVFQVTSSDDFQTALDGAQSGDVIVLEAGTTLTGSFILPNKSGSSYIHVISSALINLPPDGVRVNPSNLSNMPKIIANDPTSPALLTASGAHHFRFIGVYFGCKSGEANNGLVRLGTGSETSTEQFPHHIIIDRCIVQGDVIAGGKRGVLLSGNHLAVINSYLYDWKLNDRDAQAICGWTGNGPWKVTNNYISASGENLLVGGADPAIVDLIPSDIEIRSNTFSKPKSWNPFHSTYDGSSWVVKNALELKVGRRVLIQGNYFENNWAAAQSGSIILFTTKNQDGWATWSAIEDITFTGNTINSTLRGISISGNDGGYPSLGGRRILIKNNYFKELGGAKWGEGQSPSWTSSCAFLMTGGMDYVEIDHNTIIHGPFDSEGAFISADGAPYQNFKLTNNIFEHNRYGIKGGGTGVGNASLAAYFPGAVVARNIMIGADPALYPTDNFFPPTVNDVGFVNYSLNVDLASTSPYFNKATDGTNPGDSL